MKIRHRMLAAMLGITASLLVINGIINYKSEKNILINMYEKYEDAELNYLSSYLETAFSNIENLFITLSSEQIFIEKMPYITSYIESSNPF